MSENFGATKKFFFVFFDVKTFCIVLAWTNSHLFFVSVDICININLFVFEKLWLNFRLLFSVNSMKIRKWKR